MTDILTTSTALSVTRSPQSKHLQLKVEQHYTDKTTHTQLTPTQAIQLANALIHHALEAQGVPTP